MAREEDGNAGLAEGIESERMLGLSWKKWAPACLERCSEGLWQERRKFPGRKMPVELVLFRNFGFKEERIYGTFYFYNPVVAGATHGTITEMVVSRQAQGAQAAMVIVAKKFAEMKVGSFNCTMEGLASVSSPGRR